MALSARAAPSINARARGIVAGDPRLTAKLASLIRLQERQYLNLVSRIVAASFDGFICAASRRSESGEMLPPSSLSYELTTPECSYFVLMSTVARKALLIRIRGSFPTVRLAQPKWYL
jgi:hypothetical protein